MSYTIIRRKPHTSEVFRSEEPYKDRKSAIVMMAELNLLFSDTYIRHIERF